MGEVIQSLWVGPELSVMEQLCISSYLANGHPFHLYTYDDVRGVPAGAVIRDANGIIPSKELFVDRFGGYVNLSNLFRYSLLYKVGGWWVDMDTVCLQPFDFPEPFVFSSETSDPYRRMLINTTYIKSPPKAAFLKDCIDFTNERGHQDIHWGELGVSLISRMILRNGLGEFVKPPLCFCPVSPYQVKYVVQPYSYALPAGSYALHWWNEVWKRANMDKRASFPEGSLYEQLKRRFMG